jgi:hypothetical protein
MEDVFYIRAGDIIGVEFPIGAGPRGNASASQGKLTGKSDLVYLKIEEITSQQVVLHPQENPAGRRILR